MYTRTRQQFPTPHIEPEGIIGAEHIKLHLYHNTFTDSCKVPLQFRVRTARLPLIMGNIRSGKDFKREWRIDIGRAGDNDIVVDKDLISAHHGSFMACTLGDRLTVLYVDRNSTNGSFLNGRRIEGCVQLIPKQDHISIGGVYLQGSQDPTQLLFAYDIFATTPTTDSPYR
jgi:hypothetical protein